LGHQQRVSIRAQIALELSSSKFSALRPNLNTGEVQAEATRIEKATNTVLHDAEHPSALILADHAVNLFLASSS